MANSQKLLDHFLKTTSKRAIQKKVEASGDLIENKVVDEITKTVSNKPK